MKDVIPKMKKGTLIKKRKFQFENKSFRQKQMYSIQRDQKPPRVTRDGHTNMTRKL